jgi:hypothetical protein
MPSIQIAGEAVERFRAEPAILYLSAKQSNREVVMFPQFENSLQGASAKGLGDLVQVTDIEASQDKLILKVAIRNTKDLFWRGANSTSELIEISVGGKKYISQIRVDSEAEVSIFPRTVLINSLNPTSQLMVFRRSNDSPKKNIRLRFGDQVVASGVLKAKKEFSTLSRFDISIVATSLQTEFAELIVEESDDGENWREIGVVLCSSR